MVVTEEELEERAEAPRVSLAQVESQVLHEFYFTAAEGVCGKDGSHRLAGKAKALELLTFCTLVLRNGFTVVGLSACADPRNYKRDIGERVAKEDAMRKIWPLLGYELRTRLDRAEQAFGGAKE